jgi:hypothetical protein
MAGPHADPLQGGGWVRQKHGHLRPCAHRQGHRICRRGRRHHACVFGAHSNPSSSRTRSTVYETLERPLVPVLARMERHGIKVDRQMLSRFPAISRRAWRRWKRNCVYRRRRFQCRFAQAAWRHPVRQDGPARRQEDQDRRLGDTGLRWRSLPPKAMNSAQGARLAPASKAALHLHRGVAARDQPRHRAACTPALHGRHQHRTALVLRPEPAEHPGAHRGWPQDPQGLHRGTG